MALSEFSTFLSRVSNRLLIFFWSSSAQPITMDWNFWSTGPGGTSDEHALYSDIKWLLAFPRSFRNLLTTSSIILVACLRDSCCWGFLIVSTETSTVRVRPIKRFAVRFNSSLSPTHKKLEISVNMRHKLIHVEGVQDRPLPSAAPERISYLSSHCHLTLPFCL